MKAIKIFGLPRTCTNVTEFCICSNFKCLLLNNYPCWKHGRNSLKGRSITDVKKKICIDDLKFVICTKNPYDWLHSLYDFESRTRGNKKPFDKFLNTPCWHYKNENRVKSSGLPIDVYNELTLHWLKMYNDQTILQQVKFEDMIGDQIQVLTRLKTNFEIEEKDKLLAVETRINPARKNSQKKFKPNFGKFNKKQIQRINNQLDKKAMKIAGYEYR